MLAYQFQNSKPILAGIFIGIASFPKFLPAIMLTPFIVRRNWKVLMGFVLSWLVAVATILLIAPNAITRYLEVNRTNSIEIIMRGDNASPMVLLYEHRLGTLEIGCALLLSLVLVIVAVRLLRRARSSEIISFTEWGFFSYLCVALLPILWLYSITPLLPILVKALEKRNFPAVLAMGAIVLAFFAPPFGGETRFWLFPILVLSGFSIAANAMSEVTATPPFEVKAARGT
jgi:uncharacterized membrane protein